MTTAADLPVLDTVKKSFADAFREPKAQLAAMKWIAIAVMAINALVVIITLATRGLNDTTLALPSRPVMLLAMAAQLAVLAVFAYNFYRQELLGENRGAPILLKAGSGEITMGLTILKVFAFTGLPMTVGTLLFRNFLGPFGMVLVFAIFIAGMYAALRFILATPLSALGDHAPLKSSWDVTRPHVLRVLGGLALLVAGFYIPVAIFIVIYQIVFGYILPAFVMALLSSLVNGLIVTAFLLLVSYYIANVYRFIKA